MNRLMLCLCVLFFALASIPLQAQTQGVLREVWTQIPGYRVTDLEASTAYPKAPVLREVIPNFAAPVNWGSYYGSRLRAYLTVPETGTYYFAISGDDYCELNLSVDGDPEEASLIASVNGWTAALEWGKYEGQRSEGVALNAGQRVYIEALQKEHGGGDSVSVGWTLDPEAEPEVIDGEFLTPFQVPAPSTAPLLVEAGMMQNLYAPALTTFLHGQAMGASGDLNHLSAQWKLLAGAPVSFSDPDGFTTEVTLPGRGFYVFELSVSNRSDVAADQVVVFVFDPLDPEAGSATQALWYDVDGHDIEALLTHRNFPNQPDAIHEVTSLSGPVNYASRYGARTRGYLLPPVDGNYSIFAVGDHHVRFFLSTDDQKDYLQLVSEHMVDLPEPEQEMVFLREGERYLFEAQYMEKWSRSHHYVFWKKPGDLAYRVISGEFMAPAPVTERDSEVSAFQSDAEYLVSAGPDQEIYHPDTIALLDGHVQKRQWNSVLVSSVWSQVSGPTTARIETPGEPATEVEIDTVGTYVFALTATTENQVLSDQVTVEVKAGLAPGTGLITREVWTNRHYSDLESLRADPDFPGHPDIVDNLTAFEGPVNWGSKYGTRVTGYLQVPQSGYYTFYLSSDDHSEAFLSTDATPGNLESICAVEGNTRYRTWDVMESQRSAPRFLEAGQRYFVELHHVERWGSDHFSLGWSLEGNNQIHLMSGSFLEPAKANVSVFDGATRYYGNAGRDRRYYWPHREVSLEGRVMKIYGDETAYTTSWTQIAGPQAVMEGESTLEPNVSFPEPGVYEFELAVNDGVITHRDSVVISIDFPLAADTGHLLRSVWLNVGGRMIQDLMEADPSLGSPTFQDWQSGVETPQNWTDYFGTRLNGFLHVPVAGRYTFWIASDDQSELWLSPSADPAQKQRIAETQSAVSFRRWERYDGQRSEVMALERGVYYIEALQKEQGGSDHLSIAWEGPATNGREVISRGFLSPWAGAPLQNPEIQVILGADRTILWPNETLDLAGLVFDLNDGPQALSYEWKQVAGSGSVVFEDSTYPITAAKFSEPGIYVIELAATDGENLGSDSVIVTVQDPLAPMTGGVLREAWLGLDGWRLSDLLEDPRFPGSPSFTDVLPSFDTPLQWGDNYGQRLSALLSVPETGEYQFFIASDDQSDLLLNLDDSDPDGAVRIAYADRATGRYRWDSREGQASGPIRLEAGKRYYIEAVHRERSGSDYLSVAWKRAHTEGSPTVIAGAYLSSTVPGAPLNDGELTLELGEKREAHWPASNIELHAVALDQNPGPKPLSSQWAVLAAPGGVDPASVLFYHPASPQSAVEFPAPGDYTIQLQISDGLHSKSDSVDVTIHPPLGAKTGTILAEIFEDISGSWVTHLTNSDKYPNLPDRRFQLETFEIPQDAAERYGTLIRGYLHPPVTGVYRFNLSSDDWSEVFLSPGLEPEDRELICFVPAATRPYEWLKFPEYQISRPMHLEAGKRYYIEARHKENTNRDHLALAWHIPGSDAYEIIDGSYLEPWQFGDTTPPVVTLSGPSELTLTVGTAYNEPGFSAQDDTDGDLGEQVTTAGEVDTSTPGVYHVRYSVTDSFGNVSTLAARRVNVILDSPSPASYPPDASADHAPSNWNPSPSLTESEAARFLMQASFGPSESSVQELQDKGINAWLDEQFSLPPSLHLAHLDRMTRFRMASSQLVEGTQMDGMNMAMSMLEMGMDMEMPRLYYRDRMRTWWTLAIDAPDQLRQLTAYALSKYFRDL